MSAGEIKNVEYTYFHSCCFRKPSQQNAIVFAAKMQNVIWLMTAFWMEVYLTGLRDCGDMLTKPANAIAYCYAVLLIAKALNQKQCILIVL